MTPPHAVPDVAPVNDEWRLLAACRGCDPDPFFPTRGVVPRSAKLLCVSCPVAADCLAYANSFDNGFRIKGEIGIWGGTSQRERMRMRRAERSADRIAV